MKRLMLILLTAVVVAAIIGPSMRQTAQAQYKATAPVREKWEYGLLTINNGPPLFTTGKEQAVATPATDKGGSKVSAPGQFPDKVNIVTRDLWSPEMMTMDMLGAEGWEAISMMNIDGKGTVILMRRKML